MTYLNQSVFLRILRKVACSVNNSTVGSLALYLVSISLELTWKKKEFIMMLIVFIQQTLSLVPDSFLNVFKHSPF